MVLDGVLPGNEVVRGPALIVPFDLTAWVEHQREQQLAGAPPHAHTHPHHVHSLRRVLARHRQQQHAGGAASGARLESVSSSGDASTSQSVHTAPPPCYMQSLQVRDRLRKAGGHTRVALGQQTP